MTEQTQGLWHPDPLAECEMRRWGIDWATEEIDIESIDVAASFAIQARMNEPLTEEHVDSLTASMRRGDSFPAIVVMNGKKGKIVLGGNHRVESARRSKRKIILAYVVKTIDDEQALDELPWALNLREGLRPKQSDCIEKAVHSVEKWGTTAADAAERFCVSPSSITARLRANDVRRRLASKNISASLPDTSLAVLDRIKNDNVLVRTADLANKAKLTGTELAGVVKKVQSKRTEATQISEVESLSDKLGCSSQNGAASTVVRTRSSISQVSRIKRALTLLETSIDGKRTLSQCGFTSKAQRQDIIDQAAAVFKKWQGIVRRH